MVQKRKLDLESSCCDQLDGALSADFFRALSDPNRIVLFKELSHQAGASTVTEAAGCCSIDLSVVSRHLAMLRDAGVLESEKRGRQVFYSVPHRSIAETLRAIADAIEACGAQDNPIQKENSNA